MKTKTIIITALLLFITVFSAIAQEKYEYAVVQYIYYSKPYITISINGENYEEIEMDKSSFKGKFFGWDLNPVLKKVNEMQEKGWETYDHQASMYGTLAYIFYLRKKKN